MKPGGRKWDIVDWILVFALVGIMLTVLWFFSGCASSKKISDFDVFWSDGKCFFHAKGMSIEQAQDMKKKWDFADCKATIDVSDQVKGKKKP